MKAGNTNLTIVEAGSRREKAQFLRVPWHIYNGVTPWVPPLLCDLRAKIDPRRNPFLNYARVKLFFAKSANRQLVGRIAAIHNPLYLRHHNDLAGFFGMFECVNDPTVSARLFGAVAAFLGSYGCQSLLGPVNFSTNDESGLLLDNFDTRPTVMTNYCRPYYHALLSDAGFGKALDMFAYEAETHHPFPAKYEHVLRRVLANPAVQLRRFDRRHADQDMMTIANLYNESFSDTWGFVPLTHGEAICIGKSFLPFADDDLVWIAYYRDQPAGFILAIPDVNEILADLNGRLWPFGIFKFLAGRSRISAVRVVAFGVLPKYRALGIETALIHKVRSRILAKPYRRAEFSVVMENNERMRRLLEAIGFTLHRRYRLYRKEI